MPSLWHIPMHFRMQVLKVTKVKVTADNPIIQTADKPGNGHEPQVVIPVVARTPEGARALLSAVESRGAAAAELVAPLKRCAHLTGV